VEAACYLFLTRKRVHVGGKIFGTLSDPPRTLDGDVRMISFSELQRGIKKKSILSKEQLKGLERIKEHGDLIAHLAEISNRTIWRSASQEPDKNAFEVLTIVGESVASKDLEDTISIIATLTSKAVESGGLSSAQLP
jgi:hypothetical protein